MWIENREDAEEEERSITQQSKKKKKKKNNNRNTTRAKYIGVSFHDVRNTRFIRCFSLHFVSFEAFSGIVTL